MRTIFKYPVPITDEFAVSMPGQGHVLKVEQQGNESFMWVEVETDRPEVEYRFAVVGTGNPRPTSGAGFDALRRARRHLAGAAVRVAPVPAVGCRHGR